MMLHRSFKLALALAVLLLPGLASAVPVVLTVGTGNDGGISFSTLHSATKKPATIAGNEFRRNGDDKFSLSGSLSGDIVIGATIKVTFDPGTIVVDGGPDISVTGGMLEWPGFDPDAETNAFIGTIVTSTHGTFHFFDNQSILAPGAQTITSERILLWGNNWTGPVPTPGAIPNWGIDVGLEFPTPPAPEPGLAVLMAVGLAGLALFGRRR